MVERRLSLCEHGLHRLQVELHGGVALSGQLKTGVAGTLGFHALAVDLGLGTAAVKGNVLRQNSAVLEQLHLKCIHVRNQ